MGDVEAPTATPRGSTQLSKALADGGGAGVVAALRGMPIALVGRTSCAYSLEAQSTLASAAASLGGADAVAAFWVDSMPDGAAVHDALKAELGQKTVPYVFVNGEFLGGCDAIQKLQSSGVLASKLFQAAADHSMAYVRKAPAAAGTSGGAHGGSKKHAAAAASGAKGKHSGVEQPYSPDEHFVDPSAQPALGDATSPAYPCLGAFPEVVDSNAIRLTAIQVVVICIVGIIWRTHTWAHYMILGLALDNLARLLFGPGPSPLAQLARCGAAFLTPAFRPGVPKQFAAACGTFMATVSAAFMFLSGFDPREIIPACFLAVYAALAFLEASIDFCMGCVMFGWLVKFGLLPPQVYAIGIATKPEAEYTYQEVNKHLDLPEPQRVRVGYPGKPPSALDVRYKTKLNDHNRQSFNVIKHVKILQFNIVLGLCGLAVLFRAAAMPAIGGRAGLSLSDATGDVLAIIATVALGIFSLMYCAKAFRYPSKISKEWMCPLRSNAFVIPPATLVLIAFCAAGRFGGSTTLARVLFWIGAPATLALALWLAARWITEPHSAEHLNPAWLLPPTACFVCALVAPFLDGRYAEAAFLWFAFAVAISLPLYVITFQRSLLFNEPDDRNRPLKWAWVAVPAVACAAQVVLSAATLPTGPLNGGIDAVSLLSFDFMSRLLYLLSLSLAFLLGLLFFTGHASRLKFEVSSWSLAFPLEALALATLLYAAAIPGTLTNGMAYAALAVASATVAVLALHTLQPLLMGGIFVQDPKYGPLSQQILTHEAFRAAGERLCVAVGGLGATSKSGAVSGPALADFALQFRRYRMAHAWHAHQEEQVIFKEFEAYAPGLCTRQHEEHERDELAMARWGALVEALEAAGEGQAVAAAEAVRALQSELPPFLDQFEAHLRGEEEHLQRGGRKHLCLDLQKQMLRAIWAATPVEVWAEFLPWVVTNLPMQQQRVKFMRCWATWALPERAQLMGRMVAMGVEAPLWERLVQAVPEIAPRGASAWRKYF